MNYRLRLVLLLPLSVWLSGCQLTEQLAQLHQEHQQASDHIEHTQQGLVKQVKQGRRTPLQEVTQPWVVGGAQPLAKELRLPVALQENVPTTLLFQGQGLPLEDIAERITLATQIPVRVQAEALEFVAAKEKQLKLTGPTEALATSLDKISAFFDVYWRYEGEFIEFYKVETRSFEVRALSAQAKSQANVGNHAQETNNGFQSRSSTELEQKDSDEFANLKERLALFMTPVGRVVAQTGGGNTVVVRDTPYALDQIAHFIRQENKALTRRVRLVFEEITLSAKNQAELNIDWNLLFTSARMAASASIGGAASAATQQVGATIQQGPFSQTEAFIKAIGEVATVVRRNSMPVMSLNRRPVTHALRTTFSYVDKVESTPHISGTGISSHAVSLSQKEETVGSVLTLMPDIQEDGQVLLSVAYDNTAAQPLESLTVGSAEQGMQVQQVTIEGSGTVQQVLLRPGQPLVISGFDRDEKESAERSLGAGISALFGGGKRAKQHSLRTLIVITAQVEEGV